MSREAKEGRFWNGKLDMRVYNLLADYAQKTGLSKTWIVEQALLQYIAGKLNPNSSKGDADVS